MKESWFHKLRFTLNSGKNPKWKYYLANYSRVNVPRGFLRKRLPAILREAENREDYSYMLQRRDYYCRLRPETFIGPDAIPIGLLKVEGHKVYSLDTIRYTRWFNPKLLINLLPGDITRVPPYPSIVKSRPIEGNNANAVLLKLDRVRHFIFVKDRLRYMEKADKVLFRGKVAAKDQRLKFMQRWFRDPMVDAGDVSRKSAGPEDWKKPKLTLYEQLRYKFIMAIEGNDVASNLKWIMSSNSIAVMPRPTYETWFMEGTLIPDYHYIEVKPDFSDLKEKIQYYLAHPEKAEQIIRHANEYIDQFRDSKREDLISLMVLEKYFECTNGRGSTYEST